MWDKAQEWESKWHGNCANTYNEETKQYIYAEYMGLNEFATNWYGRRGWNFGSRSVIDIGGGPCSMLLKSAAKDRLVVDPCSYPAWVRARYEDTKIRYLKMKAEDFLEKVFVKEKVDLALIYNVLQHTEDPEKIIANIREIANEIRIFEWIDTPINEGHIHTLTSENLDRWLGGKGKSQFINRSPVVGKAYYGIFLT
jgi:2-polyprenyl-3-methyl-5-hydroxy-6-metoxy-1,4-benzoquinol methylase